MNKSYHQPGCECEAICNNFNRMGLLKWLSSNLTECWIISVSTEAVKALFLMDLLKKGIRENKSHFLCIPNRDLYVSVCLPDKRL